MRCCLAIFLSSSALLFGGCLLSPILADHDTSSVDKNMDKLQAERMERMRVNKNINQAQYEAFDAKSGSASGLPPKPTIEELEKQVEAGKSSR